MLFAPIGALYGLKEGDFYGLEASIFIGIAVVVGILIFAVPGNGGNIAMILLAVTGIVLLFRLGIFKT